jgi:hypothetical protein
MAHSRQEGVRCEPAHEQKEEVEEDDRETRQEVDEGNKYQFPQ